MKIPGVLYSIILALAAWAVQYFSGGGAGSTFVLAPVLIAAIPILLKIFTVTLSTPEVAPLPPGAARSFGEVVPGVVVPSRTRRLLLG